MVLDNDCDCFGVMNGPEEDTTTITEDGSSTILEEDDRNTAKQERSRKKTKTVKLDVGGTHYKVSRSLIESYPNTMLARLISKAWLVVDLDAPIFIDRNGDRFQYVLDYMRDKEIHLPLCVSKASILRDLEYFGFDHVNPDTIHDGYGSAEAATQIARCEALYQQELETCHKTVRHFHKKITYLNVAHACFLSYSKSGRLSEFYLGDYSLNLMTLKDDINSAFDSFNKDLFDECLKLHGLKYVSHRTIELRSYNSIWYYVSITALPSSSALH
jgi:hypothetical protein